MALISEKLRRSANGQQCTFGIAGICCHDPETTVLAHIRDDSKGLGNKAADFNAAFACRTCHAAIDEHRLSREDELFYSLRALQRTWAIWIAAGLIVLPVDPVTAKRRPHKKSNIKSRPMAGTKASGIRKRFDGSIDRPIRAKEAE